MALLLSISNLCAAVASSSTASFGIANNELVVRISMRLSSISFVLSKPSFPGLLCLSRSVCAPRFSTYSLTGLSLRRVGEVKRYVLQNLVYKLVCFSSAVLYCLRASFRSDLAFSSLAITSGVGGSDRINLAATSPPIYFSRSASSTLLATSTKSLAPLDLALSIFVSGFHIMPEIYCSSSYLVSCWIPLVHSIRSKPLLIA